MAILLHRFASPNMTFYWKKNWPENREISIPTNRDEEKNSCCL